MLLIMGRSMRFLSKLALIPKSLLLPVILAFCVVGSYALANRIFDVWVMLAFGLIGLFLDHKRIPLAPFVLGFVLWPIAEENLSAGLMATNGNWLPIITRPLSLLFLVIAGILLGAPGIRRRIARKEVQQ